MTFIRRASGALGNLRPGDSALTVRCRAILTASTHAVHSKFPHGGTSLHVHKCIIPDQAVCSLTPVRLVWLTIKPYRGWRGERGQLGSHNVTTRV
jgi:hypothetical protein